MKEIGYPVRQFCLPSAFFRAWDRRVCEHGCIAGTLSFTIDLYSTEYLSNIEVIFLKYSVLHGSPILSLSHLLSLSLFFFSFFFMLRQLLSISWRTAYDVVWLFSSFWPLSLPLVIYYLVPISSIKNSKLPSLKLLPCTTILRPSAGGIFIRAGDKMLEQNFSITHSFIYSMMLIKYWFTINESTVNLNIKYLLAYLHLFYFYKLEL